MVTHHILTPHLSGGLSLGPFLFYETRRYRSLFGHELGHVVQSLVLGPLYLPLIGLPSLFWAVLIKSGIVPRKRKDWFYTEAWAEHIAQIRRWKVKG
jgi:hypothetical protein